MKPVRDAALVAAGGALIAAGVYVAQPHAVSPAGTVPTGRANSSPVATGAARPPSSSPSALATQSPAPSGGPGPVGVIPLRLQIPKLRVDSAVIPEGVDASGGLGVPSDVRVLGWWNGGARPGAAAGSAVIDGHVDSAASGAGAFFELRTLDPGDTVTVLGAGGVTLHYTVAARREYAKSALPPEVFDQSVAGRLVLITCGGAFNRSSGHYLDNVVIYATPTA